MKTQHHQKLKTQPRPLFSCGFFRNCTQSSSLSPTTPNSPSLPLAPSQLPPSPSSPPPPTPPPPQLPSPPTRNSSLHHLESSSSSSSSASQSFTQWKFPLSASPLHHHQSTPLVSQPQTESTPRFRPPSPPPPPSFPSADLHELFHIAELQLTTGSPSDKLAALQLLERSLVPNPPSEPTCPPELMRGILLNLKNKTGAKPATKILLALCLAEGNRHVAVEAGAVGTVVEAATELEGAAAERALAALELMCMVAEGAAELRAHALAVPVMVSVMGRLGGRGREYAISVISIIYGSVGGGGNGDEEREEGKECGEREEEALAAPPEEVARAVVLALQGECTARGKRKGAQLLKTLQEYGRLDLSEDGNERL